MPEERVWSGFFEPDAVLRKLGLTATCRDLVDFGCGYGTFTLAAATIVSGKVHALDVDSGMVATTTRKANTLGLHNVRTETRDFTTNGSRLPDRNNVAIGHNGPAFIPLIPIKSNYLLITTAGL